MSNDLASIYQNNGEGQRATIKHESWWKLFPFEQSKGLLALLKSMTAYGIRFTVLGTVLGMVGGTLGGVSTNITDASNDNGALLFFLTVPIGDFLVILYGI